MFLIMEFREGSTKLVSVIGGMSVNNLATNLLRASGSAIHNLLQESLKACSDDFSF